MQSPTTDKEPTIHTFIVSVKVRLSAEEDRPDIVPHQTDASELVRIALQTLFNDGYEYDSLCWESFEIMPLPPRG